jgi:hypothetical protein
MRSMSVFTEWLFRMVSLHAKHGVKIKLMAMGMEARSCLSSMVKASLAW